MGRGGRVLGGASIVLAPLLLGVSDQLRLAAEEPAPVGANEYVADLLAIAGHEGLYASAAWWALAAALLTMPALVAIWRLSVERSPRWAWAGAATAAVGVLGQGVHLMSFYALNLTLLPFADEPVVPDLLAALDAEPFKLALYVPLFLSLLCLLPQAVGLRRARVVPLWACLLVVGATLAFAVVGSSPWGSALWSLALVVGLAPATSSMLVDDGAEAASASAPPVTVPH